MAAQKTLAGTITRETMIPIQRIGLEANAVITKGNVCVASDSGFLEVAEATDEGPFYVALESVDNTGGADAAVDCPCAVPGHYVTVVAATAAGITPGTRLKLHATADGQVISGTASLASNLCVGRYTAEEGGIVSKSGTTPFLESLADTEEFGAQVVSADGAVIEIHLGAN